MKSHGTILAVVFGVSSCLWPGVRAADPPVPATNPAAAVEALPQPAIQAGADGLISVTPGAAGTVVRYTLDGSPPSVSAGEYLAPIKLPAGFLLKARAFSAGGQVRSDVAQVAGPSGGAKPSSTLVEVTQNRDWRNYDWTKRHAACVALMKARQPDLVFLGDSITHFWGGEPRDARQRGPEVWARSFAKHNVVNLGYGWDRTENVLWRLRHGEFDGVAPQVVVLMIGTNNVGLNPPEEIAEGIRAICGEIHGRSSKTKILLLGVFPRGAKPDATRAKVAAVNSLIAGFDGQDGITYLDIGAKFLNPDGTISPEVMNDYLHPTARGYEIWAEAMGPTLDRMLGGSAK